MVSILKHSGFGKKIIERLRINGYAFDNIISVSERKFKIAKLLNNDSILGSSLSPVLKNNTHLRLDFTTSKIKLVEINIIDTLIDKLLLEIDIDTTLNDIVFKIGKVYNDFFHTNNELKNIIESFEDILNINKINKLKTVLCKLNKTLLLRDYLLYINSNIKIINFYFGASIFTIKVEYNVNTNELHSRLFMYKKNYKKYTLSFQWDIADEAIKLKYAPVIATILKIKYLTVETTELYIKAFEDIKKLKSEITR